MKKYISHLVFALLGCAALSACVDDDYMELDKGQNELVLTASKTEVVLNEQAHADDALELSWTTGTNYGTGNKISYTLELTKTGSDFADSYVAVENAVQEYSWKKSVEELNDILRNHFGATAGENISLEARLTATVTERDEKQVSTTAFSVTAYKPLTSTLYLIGSATPGGWSADDATEMTRKDNGIFTWTGRLVAGEFKFITTLGSFLPSYNKGTDGLLVLRSSDDQPDEPFVVEEDHNYIVEANLFTGVLTLTQTETLAPAYDQLYFVGNATDWGFVKMKQDVLDPYLFRFGKFFEVGKGGEFKFGTSDGSWENMYKAKNADAAYTDTEVVFVKGFDPDNKWVLKDGECGKAYKICMDIRSGKERMMMSEFTPYEMIYMVGDATPAGWTIGDATPMQTTDNPYVFTWKGTLNAGEFKFITTLGSFLPSYNKGTDGLLVLRSSDDQPDEPFVVEEDHNYIVEANLFTGVLTLTQTETLAPAYDQLYFVGNATDWGFVKMKQDVLDPYLFRFGKFFEVGKGGEFKFGTSDGSWENMYKAKNADAAYTDTEVVFVKGFDPDNKWVLKDGECGKAYKICMDIRSGKERMMMSEFTPYEMIYMVGDATPAGWTIGDATPMQTTDNPYVFTWKGTLNAGELKFTCDKQEDWNGAWFMPAVADKQPAGETEPMLFLDKSDEAFKAQYLDVMVGGIDQKWKITTAGSYLITLNQLEETISIVKQ